MVVAVGNVLEGQFHLPERRHWQDTHHDTPVAPGGT